MVKAFKTFSIDADLIPLLKLRNINSSKIINDYLKSYLKAETETDQPLEQLKEQMIKAEAEKVKATEAYAAAEAEHKRKAEKEAKKIVIDFK